MAEYIDYFYDLQEHRFTDSSPKCDETLCTAFFPNILMKRKTAQIVILRASRRSDIRHYCLIAHFFKKPEMKLSTRIMYFVFECSLK